MLHVNAVGKGWPRVAGWVHPSQCLCVPTDWRQTGGKEGCGASLPSLPAPYRPNPPPLQPGPANPHAARDCNDEHASAAHWHASRRFSTLCLVEISPSNRARPSPTHDERPSTTSATAQSRCKHVSLHRGSGIGGPNGHGALLKWGEGIFGGDQWTVKDCPEPDTGDRPHPECWYRAPSYP